MALAASCAAAISPADVRAADLPFQLLKLGGATVRWAQPPEGLPTRVTYAFLDAALDSPTSRNCRSMGPVDELLARSRISLDAFKAEVRAAFAQWTDAANIEFVETEDASRAGIRVGAQREPEGRAFADVAYRVSRPGTHEIERSLICLNPERTWKVGFDGNLAVYDIRYTIAHEIGHAIGLDHPSPGNQLMSHRYLETFRSLQAGDVSGAVAIYGAPLRPAATTKITATSSERRAQ